jgi:hypothetical protein
MGAGLEGRPMSSALGECSGTNSVPPAKKKRRMFSNNPGINSSKAAV